MSTFFLLTIFPLLPLIAYFLFMQEWIFPIDRVVCWVHFLLLLAESLLGFQTLRFFIACQTTQFVRLCKEEANEKAREEEDGLYEMASLYAPSQDTRDVQNQEKEPLLSS